ncbi:hypothetical protein [Lysinibacillus capsici]|uniref:hypothetical protein n=1 Tax=Lysinibacillus capsici TaxID=2115968 RepID=UPI003D03488E
MGLAAFVGTIEGIIEQFIKYRKVTTEEDLSCQQETSTFLTKQMISIFIYKMLRLLLMLVILSTSLISLLKVIMTFMGIEFGSTNLNAVVLMASFKIYKVFTKLMPDVVNGTDEAANDVSKLYITVLRLDEWLKSLISSISETKKNSTNNNDDTQ